MSTHTPISTGSRPGPPPSAPAGQPISPRDAGWDGYHYVVVVGPLDGLDPDRARRVLLERAAELGHLLRVRTGSRTWVPAPGALAGHLERVVVAAPDLDGSCGSAARVLGQPLDGMALRLSVGPTHVALHTDHVVGDATAVYDLLPWLLRTACTDDPGATPSMLSFGTPFRSALQHTFGSRPWAEAVRRTAVHVLAERRAHAAPPPAGWDRRPSVVEAATLAAGGLEDMRSFRRAHASGLSSGFMLMAAVWWSLVQHDVVSPDLRPGVGMDLRRFLPRRTPVFGNFSACVRLPQDSPVHPVALRDVVEAEAATGVPLLASSGQVTLATVRSAVPRPRRSLPVAEHHAAGLVLNYMGRPPGYEKLPWQPGAPRALVNAPSVDSSRALTVNIVEMADGPHITASFYDAVIPRAAVRAALDDVSLRMGEVLEEMQRAR